MNIGVDIDNVVTNFDSSILKEFIKENKNKRGKGLYLLAQEYLKNIK